MVVLSVLYCRMWLSGVVCCSSVACIDNIYCSQYSCYQLRSISRPADASSAANAVLYFSVPELNSF